MKHGPQPACRAPASPGRKGLAFESIPLGWFSQKPPRFGGRGALEGSNPVSDSQQDRSQHSVRVAVALWPESLQRWRSPTSFAGPHTGILPRVNIASWPQE